MSVKEQVAPPVDFEAFVASRKLPNSRYWRSYCRICNEPIRVLPETLRAEWRGFKRTCEKCGDDAGLRSSHNCSGQESHDISYHGSRFHSGEW